MFKVVSELCTGESLPRREREREMWGKAVKAESPSGNGIVLASAETGQVGVGEREREDISQSSTTWQKSVPV